VYDWYGIEQFCRRCLTPSKLRILENQNLGLVVAKPGKFLKIWERYRSAIAAALRYDLHPCSRNATCC